MIHLTKISAKHYVVVNGRRPKIRCITHPVYGASMVGISSQIAYGGYKLKISATAPTKQHIHCHIHGSKF